MKTLLGSALPPLSQLKIEMSDDTASHDDIDTLNKLLLLTRIVEAPKDKLYLAFCTGNFYIIKTVIDNLLAVERENDKKNMALRNLMLCSICYEQVSDRAAMTSCGHLFCHGCITHALDVTSACPSCRQTVTNLVPCGGLFQQLNASIGSSQESVSDILLECVFPNLSNVPRDLIDYLVDVCKDKINNHHIQKMMSTAMKTQSEYLMNLSIELQESCIADKMDIVQICEVAYSTTRELTIEFLMILLRYLEKDATLLNISQCKSHDSLFFLRSYRRHIAYLSRHNAQYTTNISNA